ncbi:MAG: glycosyl hydrolase, partial [Syntrophothermus sp.]
MTNRPVTLLSILFFTIFFTISSEAQPVNPNATKETRDLMVFLRSVYGQKILSGQVDDKYLQYIKDATGGKEPAIMGYDFNGICPSQGGNNDANKAIKWVKERKGIAQFQWHWISPNADGDFYTKNYNLANALADTNSSSYKNLIRDIDLVAAAMKKMQDAGVPILWRPLHEAEGAWFWWGMSGGTACKKLWRLMYDRYTNYHKLNNLIWVWNS